MRLELEERRVLGAIRFLDAATRLQVLDRLSVEAEGVTLTRNRRAYYVIFSAPGLESHTKAFEAPPNDLVPGSVKIKLKIADPANRYLPRHRTVQLPLNPDPQKAGKEFSLFTPIDVNLFASPAASSAPGSAIIRATVKEKDTNNRLPGALIRVIAADNRTTLARGMSDGRGEALVTVPGVPITTWGEDDHDAVLAHEIDVTLETIFDPEAGDAPDPDDMEKRRADLPSSSVAAKLASGHVRIVELSVPLP